MAKLVMKVKTPPNYKAGRMTSSGDIESDETKPDNENSEKYQLRKKTQEEGSRMYTYKGKTEFAGEQGSLNELRPRGMEKSEVKVDIREPKKVPVKVVVKKKQSTGTINGDRPLKSRQLAPGLDGKPNRLQQKY